MAFETVFVQQPEEGEMEPVTGTYTMVIGEEGKELENLEPQPTLAQDEIDEIMERFTVHTLG